MRSLGPGKVIEPMPRLEYFPFRFRDRVTGKWLLARYLAERQVIAERYKDTESEITGPAEIRDIDPSARYFSPWSDISHAESLCAMAAGDRCNGAISNGAVLAALRQILRST
jgi:hypothetical protein